MNIDSLAKTRPSKSIFRYDTLNYQSNFITTIADTGKYYYSGRYNKSLYETNSRHRFIARIMQYYVSNELKISPGTYQKHLSYNWDFYGEQASGGLILKSEHRFRHFTMYGLANAVNVEPGNFKALEIDENLFSQICK